MKRYDTLTPKRNEAFIDRCLRIHMALAPYATLRQVVDEALKPVRCNFYVSFDRAIALLRRLRTARSLHRDLASPALQLAAAIELQLQHRLRACTSGREDTDSVDATDAEVVDDQARQEALVDLLIEPCAPRFFIRPATALRIYQRWRADHPLMSLPAKRTLSLQNPKRKHRRHRHAS